MFLFYYFLFCVKHKASVEQFRFKEQKMVNYSSHISYILNKISPFLINNSVTQHDNVSLELISCFFSLPFIKLTMSYFFLSFFYLSIPPFNLFCNKNVKKRFLLFICFCKFLNEIRTSKNKHIFLTYILQHSVLYYLL